jgi:hypothetical protein
MLNLHFDNPIGKKTKLLGKKSKRSVQLRRNRDE